MSDHVAKLLRWKTRRKLAPAAVEADGPRFVFTEAQAVELACPENEFLELYYPEFEEALECRETGWVEPDPRAPHEPSAPVQRDIQITGLCDEDARRVVAQVVEMCREIAGSRPGWMDRLRLPSSLTPLVRDLLHRDRAWPTLCAALIGVILTLSARLAATPVAPAVVVDTTPAVEAARAVERVEPAEVPVEVLGSERP